MTPDDSFEATYAVKMHCKGCTDEIRACLQGLPGLHELRFDLGQQLMSVSGSAAPSAIVSALRRCGRDAIIRGTGGPNSSAVSILEAHAAPAAAAGAPAAAVQGLVRMVQVADRRTLFDISVNGVPRPGDYYASVRAQGDLSQGALSTGPAWYAFDEPVRCRDRNDRGLYAGRALLRAPLSVCDLIGRGFVVTADRRQPHAADMCGVVARSAGSWENTKQVCACSGKTVWQERDDALHHNID